MRLTNRLIVGKLDEHRSISPKRETVKNGRCPIGPVSHGPFSLEIRMPGHNRIQTDPLPGLTPP